MSDMEFLEEVNRKKHNFAWKLCDSFTKYQSSTEEIKEVVSLMKKKIKSLSIEKLLKQKNKEKVFEKWEKELNELFEKYVYLSSSPKKGEVKKG